MSTEVDDDISVLNINEVCEGGVGDGGLNDPWAVNRNPLPQENIGSKRAELSAFEVMRQNDPGVLVDWKTTVVNRQNDDLFKELQTMRDASRSVYQERTVAKDLGSIQNECLHLRGKVSSLFRENCSLKEQSAKLTIDNRSYQKQIDLLRQDNVKLRDRLQQFSQQIKCFVQNKDTPSCTNPPMPLSQPDHLTLVFDVLSGLPKYVDSIKEQGNSPVQEQNPRKASPLATEDRVSTSNLLSLELDRDNLEQISHKLLEHLKQEKKEMEHQYSQMLEVQKASATNGMSESMQACFNSVDVKEREMFTLLEACRTSSKLLQQEAHIQNQLMKAMLRQMSLIETLQKTIPLLQAKVTDVHPVPSHANFKSCTQKTNDQQDERGKVCGASRVSEESGASPKPRASSTLESFYCSYNMNLAESDGRNEGNARPSREPTECAGPGCDEDRICPMCQAVFPKTIPLPEFEAHVMEHFRSEEFEIITQDMDFS